MSGAWRCFVSVPIGEDLRRDLASALEAWRPRPDLVQLRWSDPASWHLTLAFLGDSIPTHRCAGRRAGSGGRATSPVRSAHRWPGGFPSGGRARVAWYGIEDREGSLRRLADDVGRAVDLEPDRPFSAHVTLGRSRAGGLDLRAWIRDGRAPHGSLDVDRVELLRSHVGRGPAHYEALASAPLGRPAHE